MKLFNWVLLKNTKLATYIDFRSDQTKPLITIWFWPFYIRLKPIKEKPRQHGTKDLLFREGTKIGCNIQLPYFRLKTKSKLLYNTLKTQEILENYELGRKT